MIIQGRQKADKTIIIKNKIILRLCLLFEGFFWNYYLKKLI